MIHFQLQFNTKKGFQKHNQGHGIIENFPKGEVNVSRDCQNLL